jgi:hypothetical protein
VSQSEEGEAVPGRARGGAHGGAQQAVEPLLVLEPAVSDQHHHVFAPEAVDQPGARQWQPWIRGRRNAGLGVAALVGLLLQEVLGRTNAKIGVVGDLQGAAAGTLRKAAPGVGLDAPGDAAEQELLVIRARLLAEHLAVLLLELRRGEVAEGLDLLSNLGFCLHGVNQQSHEGSLSLRSQLAGSPD